MESYQFNQGYGGGDEYEVKEQKSTSLLFSMTGVYLWMGFALLISGAVSMGLGFAFPSILSTETGAMAMLAASIISLILMLVSSIMLHVASFRQNFGLMLTFYIIYAVSIGVALSFVMYEYIATDQTSTIFVAFLATAVCFIGMGLFGAITKKDLGILVPVLFTLILGAVIISVVNIFIGSELIYWLADFVVFGVILLFVAIDTQRVKRIAMDGGFENNRTLTLYCAYMLYVDFINLFIRILSYLGRSRR